MSDSDMRATRNTIPGYRFAHPGYEARERISTEGWAKSPLTPYHVPLRSGDFAHAVETSDQTAVGAGCKLAATRQRPGMTPSEPLAAGPAWGNPLSVGAPKGLPAGVAELADARDLGSRDESRGGSNPSARTSVGPSAQSFTAIGPRPFEVIVAMEVTETLSDGLKREFQVQVPAADLEARLSARLEDLKQRVQLRGFRPGKVPVTHLKKIYGKAVMAETINAVITELNGKIVSERGLKLATEPKVTIPDEETEVEKVIGGKADLAYTLALELLPKIELGDFKGLALDRLVAPVTDAEVDEAVAKLAEQNKPYAAKPEGAKVESGDRVVIDYSGRVDGQSFEGGTGTDIAVNIGSGTFLPGFEDQLLGVSAGETRVVKVTFPAGYAKAELAGKEAEFEVSAKSIEAAGTVAVNDEFAKSLGLNSLDKLKQAIRGRLQQEHAAASRQRLKRQLLDKLDAMHRFALPPTMAQDEFKNVWSAVEEDLKAQARTFADEGTTEDKAREEYRAIAERRVRLGLVLAEIGERNRITVTDEEIRRAIVDRARQLPGHEQQVWDYYQKNPQAVAAIRAPIFEDKVVDFVVELASVTEKEVSRDELFRDDEDEEKPAAP